MAALPFSVRTIICGPSSKPGFVIAHQLAPVPLDERLEIRWLAARLPVLLAAFLDGEEPSRISSSTSAGRE